MTVFDIWAGMAYLLLDVCAPLSILGSLILATGGVFSALRGARFRAPEEVYAWSGGSLFIGVLGLFSITVSDQMTIEKTPFLGLSLVTVGLMLTVSALLLIVGKILEASVRSRAVPLTPPRRYTRQNRRS